MIDDVIKIFKKEISGQNAKRYVSNISHFHRIQASPGLEKATEYVKSKLLEFGYRAEKYQYPADGKAEYLGFRAPIGWKIKDAELKIVEPEEVWLGQFIENPTLVVAHSGSIPQGIKAEVVDVGKGVKNSDYSVPVEGKFVIASGHPRIVYEEAVVKRKAAGIIFYRENVSNPRAHPYLGFWPTEEEVEALRPMFSISLEKALKIKEMLRKGKVVIEARIDAEFYKGNIGVLEARLPGSSTKDVLLIAHICHPMPGANDNASGSGLLLELARVARRLYENKVLKLGYGLRFWWVPEFSGVYAHLAEKPEVLDEIVSVINLDMVGGCQDKVGGVLTIVGVAEFYPSFIPILAHYIFEKVVEGPKAYARPETLPLLRFKLVGYEGGSDHHIFVDPCRKIPATAFIEWPDKYYHSDLDIVDNIDPGLLKVVGTAALTLAYTVSKMKEELFDECLQAIYSSVLSSLWSNAKKLVGKPKWYASKKVGMLSRMYAEAINSLSILNLTEDQRLKLRECYRRVRESGYRIKKEIEENWYLKDEEEPVLNNVDVYERKKKSIVRIYYIYKNLKGKDKEWWLEEIIEKKRGFIVDFFYYFVDGRRSLSEIYDILKLIYEDLKGEDLERIAKILEKTGWLKKKTSQ